MTRQVLVDAALLERLAGYAERLGDGDAWPTPDEVEDIDSDVSFARLALTQPPAEPERALDKLGQIAFEAFQVSYDLPLLRKYENMMPGERRAWRAVAAALIQPPAEPERKQARLTLKTDLRTPDQLDTIPTELLAAVARLGAGQAVLTLDGNKAQWAAERLGLSEVTVERVMVLVRIDERAQPAPEQPHKVPQAEVGE